MCETPVTVVMMMMMCVYVGVKGGIVAVGVTSSSQRPCDSQTESVVTATYVMSPLLVIAFAIAGTIAVDLTTEPLGDFNIIVNVNCEFMLCTVAEFYCF